MIYNNSERPPWFALTAQNKSSVALKHTHREHCRADRPAVQWVLCETLLCFFQNESISLIQLLSLKLIWSCTLHPLTGIQGSVPELFNVILRERNCSSPPGKLKCGGGVCV